MGVSALGGLFPGEGAWSGGVSAPRGGCMVRGCLLPGGCMVWGVSAPRGGVHGLGGHLVRGGGVSAPRGWYPSMH